MDNDGQPMGNEDPNLIGGVDGGNDENVDQYFDDGGETFLPADHVSFTLMQWQGRQLPRTSPCSH